jgi:hypothetical protein
VLDKLAKSRSAAVIQTLIEYLLPCQRS